MKILEIQDIHVNPSWYEESKKDIERICEVAEQEGVSAICVAGDFFHRAVMATDSNKWDQILELARKLQKAAQVYYVHGTPSHDAPGSYSSFKDIGWKEVAIGESHIHGDLLIMGIPEITPAILMGKFPELSKAEINQKQYELVNILIDTYYAPMAKQHNGPVHFMAHGHVSGSKFRDDQKPRSTDFMYSEEMLKRIDADRYQFGHLHLPQEFKTINGGYGGSSHLTWGDLGFKPGFNIVEYFDHCEQHCIVKRFDYGKLERQKIVIKDIETIEKLGDLIKPNVDLWIDIECDKAFADQFDIKKSLEQLKSIRPDIGPNSKITLNIQHEEQTRVSTEEYEACKTTEDLYRMFDKDATESILYKVKEAEEATHMGSVSVKKRRFELLDVYLRGSKAGLENGVEEIRISMDDFNFGPNILTGPNGTGKSFLLGFCTPYSEHLPSGLDFKQLFELKDSQVVRRFKDGNDILTQKIVIDPTLAAPTAKYYMDINGTPVEEVTGNKAPFDDSVLEIFGSVRMFMASVFLGQEASDKYPSLVKAKESDLRQIFSELAGIDRTPLKKYAHEKVTELKRNIELDSREIETLEGLVEEPRALKKQLETATSEKAKKESYLTGCKKSLSDYQAAKQGILNIKDGNIAIQSKITDATTEIAKLNSENDFLREELHKVNNLLQNGELYRRELSDLKKIESEHKELSGKYFVLLSEHNKRLDLWNKNKDDIQKSLDVIQEKAETLKGNKLQLEAFKKDSVNAIEKNDALIEQINKPCEHCNKLSSSADAEISELTKYNSELAEQIKSDESQILEIDKNINALRSDYVAKQKQIGTRPEENPKIAELKIKIDSLYVETDKIEDLTKKLESLKSSEDRSKEITNKANDNVAKISEIETRIIELNKQIKPVDQEALDKLEADILELETAISETTTNIGELTAQIKAVIERSVENDKRHEKIKWTLQRVSTETSDKTDWERIEAAFSPKGIPAMELSLIAPLINQEANRLLKVYSPRFQVQIITQDYDSKGKNLLEKFKILVHDSMANEVKNLPIMSGGQKVWAMVALKEGIDFMNRNRTGREWGYSINDETDGPLDHEIIPAYYELLKSINTDKKIICVSHSLKAREVVENVKEITEFFIGYGEE